MITPEQAREELKRRELINKGETLSPTPEQARAELARRGISLPQPQEAPQDINRSPRNAALDLSLPLEERKKAAAENRKAFSRQVGRVGRAAASGIAGLADIPNLAALGLHAADLKETPTFYEPISSRVQNKIDTLTKGKLRPQSKAEEYADIIGEGLAPLALAPLTGGASLTGLGARALAKKATSDIAKNAASKIANIGSRTYATTKANIAGNIGSSAASKAYLDEHPNDVGGAILAGLAGGTTGSISGNVLKHGPKNVAARGTGKLLGIDSEKAEALKNLPYSVADISNNKFVQGAQHKLDWTPLGSGTMNKFYETQGKALRKAIGRGELPANEEEVGRLIHGAASRLKESHTLKQNASEEAFSKALKNKDAYVKAKNALDFNRKNLSEYTTNEAKRLHQQKADYKFGSSLEKMAKELNYSPADIGGEKVNLNDPKYHNLRDAVNTAINDSVASLPITNEYIPFNDLRALRRNIDDQISTFGQIGNITQGNLKRLRGRIKEDLNNHFNTLGGKARDSWHEFNQREHLFQKNEKPHINEVFKNSEESFTKVFLDTLKGITERSAIPRKFAIMHKELTPTNRNKLFEASINELGKTADGWSAIKAKTNFNKMRPVQQDVLLKYLPNKKARTQFRKTINGIEAISKKSAALNTSGTAHHLEINNQISALKDIAKKIGSVGTAAGAGALGGGLEGGIAGLLGGLALPYLAAKGVSSKRLPALVERMNKTPKLEITHGFGPLRSGRISQAEQERKKELPPFE